MNTDPPPKQQQQKKQKTKRINKKPKKTWGCTKGGQCMCLYEWEYAATTEPR